VSARVQLRAWSFASRLRAGSGRLTISLPRLAQSLVTAARPLRVQATQFSSVEGLPGGSTVRELADLLGSNSVMEHSSTTNDQ